MEHLLELGADDVEPAVVDDHDVELFGAIDLVLVTRPGDLGRVHGQRLPGRRASEQGHHQVELIPVLNDSLHAHHHHVNRRQRRDHASVPFVGHDDHRARVGNGEVASADPHAGVEELLSERPSGERAEFLGVGAEVVAPVTVEELRDRGGALVECGSEDVGRGLVGELDDPLPEIGFDDFDAVTLEGMVEFDLLGQHRLRLHRHAHVVAASDVENGRVRLVGVGGPVNLGTAPFGGGGETIEGRGQVPDDMVACRAGRVAKFVEVGEVVGPVRGESVRSIDESPLQLWVVERDGCTGS